MSALLVSACGFNEPKKFTIIKENHDIEGGFLISSLIGQRLRQQNAGIVLICCQQTFKYYDQCGKKLGYNLSMSLSKKCLDVIEPLRELLILSQEKYSLVSLMDNIMNRVEQMIAENRKNITIIVDNMEFFTNLDATEKDLIKFGTSLQELSNKRDNISVVLKVGLCDYHHTLSNNLEDLADVVLTVEKLQSGDFWDVDGKLTIRKMNYKNEELINNLESERSLLYFISDHNIKLSAPGEFGLKV